MKKVALERMNDKERAAASNEVAILSRLHHPNIICHRESFMHGNDLCIVMEYADGGGVVAHACVPLASCRVALR
jgi:NIMA (never in mitosis gene a)-related kinase